MNPDLIRNVASLVRALLFLIGAQNVFEPDMLEKVAGALAFLGFAVWTWRKNRTPSPAPLQPPEPADLLEDMRVLPDRKPLKPRGKTVR